MVKADNGFPRKSAYPLPVGLGTSMTRDMSGFSKLIHYSSHYSKPYLEFLNAEAFEKAKGKSLYENCLQLSHEYRLGEKLCKRMVELSPVKNEGPAWS